MIDSFKELIKDKQMEGWSLHLAGSVEGDPEYVNELKKLVENIPVNFYPNLPFEKLIELYGKSSIYWHAAGFKEEDPVLMEHFGITTVEAMAAGCVPIIINKGGQSEIVDNGINGYLWETTEELISFTKKIIQGPSIREKISEEAVLKSKFFSKSNFSENLNLIIKNL
jgi:glycosyltransferase involved in cell wall biosynthesis